ncbi:MAG: DUF871 domain-containing protein [Selenomonadaceae bacterium]|nr:DUF871 domain-containing protein [Selenomonadaceae bacterium]
MENGISVYAGLGYKQKENIELIKFAAKIGMKRLFTSTHVPESSAEGDNFFNDFAEIITAAATNDFEIILDVNPENIEEFNVSGLTLRLDDGFSVEQIVELSKTSKIQLNASTVTNEFLTILLNLNANFANISALHNFYPHVLTGLDTYFFIDQNKMLHDFGINVGAFVPSLNGKRRAPLFEGLPTLEDCRNFSTDLSARFLAALGTDFIIIGDGLPTEEEVIAVASTKENEVVMDVKLLTDDLTSIELLKNTFTRRPDISKSVIRAVEGRQFFKQIGGTIEPENFSAERNFGVVTIDNKNFGRYAGEIQIVEDILPADERVNTVARIVDEEVFLAGYIKPNQKFSFRFV